MPVTNLEISLKEGTARIEYHADVEPILERNKKLRSQEQKSDWGRHVATIPNAICLKWLNECWDHGRDVRFLSPEWDELVAQKLKDPDYAYLRVDGPSHQLGWTK